MKIEKNNNIYSDCMSIQQSASSSIAEVASCVDMQSEYISNGRSMRAISIVMIFVTTDAYHYSAT